MTAALQQSLQGTSRHFQFCLNTTHTELEARELNKSRGRLCNRIGDEGFQGENSSAISERGTSEEGFFSSGTKFNADGGNFQPGPHLIILY